MYGHFKIVDQLGWGSFRIFTKPIDEHNGLKIYECEAKPGNAQIELFNKGVLIKAYNHVALDQRGYGYIYDIDRKEVAVYLGKSEVKPDKLQ